MLAALPFPANHGTAGSIRELAEAIMERGHVVHIVTYHFGEPIPVRGPRVHRVSALTGESSVVVGPTVRKPLYDLQLVFKAVDVIRRYRCDLIHAHGYEGVMVAWLCRLLTGRPVVYSAHMTMIDELETFNFIRPRFLAKPLARLLDAFVPRIGDRCIPHSDNLRRFFLSKGLHARSEPVIYKGIDTDSSPPGDGAAVRRRYALGDGPVIVYAGMTAGFQRLDLLLEAFAVVRKSQPDARLLLILTIRNEGHLAEFHRQARELGLADHVVVTDPQPLESVREHLAAADVAVVSRPHCSGFPIKVLNYMACRKPCVLFASSASGLTHGENAWLVRTDTSEALGRGILEVLRDPGLARRLAHNGYHYVRTHRNRRGAAQKVCAAYFRALTAAGRPSAPRPVNGKPAGEAP